jgi:hypothetical protein
MIMEKLRLLPTAVAMGATWAMGVMLLGWISITGWGTRFVDVLSSIDVGFRPTFIGGIVGGLWAFADAFAAGAVFALVFNAIAARHERFPSLTGRETADMAATAPAHR